MPHRWRLTPFLFKLGARKTHFDKHLLQEASPFVVPGLQPDSHIGGMQHGLIQAPVAHEREAVVVNLPAVQKSRVSADGAQLQAVLSRACCFLEDSMVV